MPTYQRAPALPETLAALCELDYPHKLLEIIVVDDGSTDATAVAASRFPRIRYVRQPNLGVASARNHGARLADGEILLFVDDDIIVGWDNVRRHVDAHNAYADCVIAGHPELSPEVNAALVRSPLGRFRLQFEDRVRQAEATHGGGQGRVEVEAAGTANLSISRNLFWKIGGFDERFPVGAEDQDLCWRARAAGAMIVRDHDIRIVHNDPHRDLGSILSRQQRGAVGIVYLARKHSDFPAPLSLDVNGPVCRTDSPRLVARKLVRGVLSRPAALVVALRVVRWVERVRPEGGWPLEDLYHAMTGLYVFRGIRQGLRLTGEDTWPRSHSQLSGAEREVGPENTGVSIGST